MRKSFWFYLEPYVHISLKHDGLLVYNPLNGKLIELQDAPLVTRLLKQLQSKKNLWVVKLSEEDVKKIEIAQFVEKVKEFFMGDMLDTAWRKGKPIQVVPEVKIMREVSKYASLLSGDEIKEYLSTISFYINNYLQQETGIFNNAYKQFLWPLARGAGIQELPLEKMIAFIEEAQSPAFRRINILGGNIFHYSNFSNLLGYLNPLPVVKAYYVFYQDLAVLRPDALSMLIHHPGGNRNQRIELNIAMDFPVQREVFGTVVNLLEKVGMQAKFLFAVEKEDDLECVDQLVSQYKLRFFLFCPYFNGDNRDFFGKAVYITREELLETKLSQEDIFRRKMMNSYHFGKLIILNNGDIYANVNAPKLGRLGVDSLYDVVYKEMTGGKTWVRSRSKVRPCKQCVFEFICPPLSGYEYALGQNNLCDIKL